jgi:hypothetical protein
MMSMTKSFKRPVRSNMVIDEGSSATLFDTETSVKRGFQGKPQIQMITTVGNKKQTVQNKSGYIYLRAIKGGPIRKVKCATFDLPTGIIPPRPAQLRAKFPILKDIELEEPARGGIHLLLGFDNQHLMYVCMYVRILFSGTLLWSD